MEWTLGMLARLVVEMREAQKDYLHLRTQAALVQMRVLERRVDGALLQVVNERVGESANQLVSEIRGGA